ncbi:unnamed protein product [Amoebophrya sp. A25]|nr:unnamed protein product [Amoebophrya sp. A25]|eukprot:GSA25T00001745001.1
MTHRRKLGVQPTSRARCARITGATNANPRRRFRLYVSSVPVSSIWTSDLLCPILSAARTFSEAEAVRIAADRGSDVANNSVGGCSNNATAHATTTESAGCSTFPYNVAAPSSLKCATSTGRATILVEMKAAQESSNGCDKKEEPSHSCVSVESDDGILDEEEFDAAPSTQELSSDLDITREEPNFHGGPAPNVAGELECDRQARWTNVLAQLETALLRVVPLTRESGLPNSPDKLQKHTLSANSAGPSVTSTKVTTPLVRIVTRPARQSVNVFARPLREAIRSDWNPEFATWLSGVQNQLAALLDRRHAHIPSRIAEAGLVHPLVNCSASLFELGSSDSASKVCNAATGIAPPSAKEENIIADDAGGGGESFNRRASSSGHSRDAPKKRDAYDSIVQSTEDGINEEREDSSSEGLTATATTLTSTGLPADDACSGSTEGPQFCKFLLPKTTRDGETSKTVEKKKKRSTTTAKQTQRRSSTFSSTSKTTSPGVDNNEKLASTSISSSRRSDDMFSTTPPVDESVTDGSKDFRCCHKCHHCHGGESSVKASGRHRSCNKDAVREY